MSEDPEWNYPHENDMPSDNRAVAVLVAHKDRTFSPDIGRYYKDGWSLQFFTDTPVIAWTNLPSFSDHVAPVEVDESDQ